MRSFSLPNVWTVLEIYTVELNLHKNNVYVINSNFISKIYTFNRKQVHEYSVALFKRKAGLAEVP